jgi:dTDP-4-dehydrorhamnose reductase
MAATRTIVALGAEGALGQALTRVVRKHPEIRFIPLTKKDADITDRRTVDNAIRKYEAQVVINCAAFTDVDGCENDTLLASAVNDEGAKNVAEACRAANVLVVHISTDFIFDGASANPYKENDNPNPINVYGATKLAGERHLRMEAGSKYLIVRTAWTFGPGKDNFITKVIKRARSDGKLDIIQNQTGSPTYTIDLAKGILLLLFSGAHGIYNVVNTGSCNRLELAKAALIRAGLGSVTVNPAESVQGRPGRQIARRPAYSVLDTTAFTQKTGITLPRWDFALAEYLGSEEAEKPA